ncbi:MAG: FxLYD domain-containing protein [Bryobacteraceae bacterium]
MVSDPVQEKSNLIIPLLIIGGLLPLIAGGWWYLDRESAKPPVQPGITAEGKNYVSNLKLSQVQMKATANFTGAAVIEVEGQITNNGNRTLSRVELNCIFYDVSGFVVLRERVPIVKAPMKPGDTRQFRLPFEGVAPSWNQTLPQLVIAHIAFVQ